MRYFIKSEKNVLDWLLEIDAKPSTLPFFSQDETLGLVVAQLISGTVLAEVLPAPEQVPIACGTGIPLGRLYFQIPRDRLYNVCPELSPESFRGEAA
jgi:hypothetical protein